MQEILTSLSGFLTLLIALIAVMIAYQQWKTNKAQQVTDEKRLKHELYDKRFAIYQAARTFLRDVVVKPTITDKMLIDYWAGINAARFLLDDEISDYLEEIEHKAVDLQTNQISIGGKGNVAEGSKERGELKKWFYHQISVLNQKFYPYLNLEH